MDEAQSDTFSGPQLLGGNIELSGFNALDGGSMIVLKKIIGNYARRFSDNYGSQKLALKIRQDGGSFLLLGSVLKNSQELVAEHSDANVFFVVDAVLKKLEQRLTSS